jgi:hypothetical protein
MPAGGNTPLSNRLSFRDGVCLFHTSRPIEHRHRVGNHSSRATPIRAIGAKPCQTSAVGAPYDGPLYRSIALRVAPPGLVAAAQRGAKTQEGQ